MTVSGLHVIASAAKQSILSLRGEMDCFASLAMTLGCLKIESENRAGGSCKPSCVNNHRREPAG
jgi:hypothetical protein